MSEIRLVSRTKAVNIVINNIEAGLDNAQLLDELVHEVEAVVTQSGGEANPAASLRALSKTIKCAEELGVLAVTRVVSVERIV